ncbi:Primosome assembly protein PriA [Alteracholeplasma palmae J233]|uniref:Replication restart protein PriA n=1 Tax=Alteracholeplasma palmae (strain ATCC 49389 / J233) TaxID=1318466 RepID=U4KKF0_ALTPJ|nr:primosomal protein N' [Alteracholeplasma palmae]CCV64033.1 Primosome assembly protein PriA [Alteracholeplasma palmae J233]
MIAQIVIDLKASELNKYYDYIIPEAMQLDLKKGMRVIVPFGNMKRLGYIINLIPESTQATRKIEKILDITPSIDEELFLIADYLLKTPFSLMSAVYQTILPKELLLNYQKKITILDSSKIDDEIIKKFNKKNEWILTNKDEETFYNSLKKLKENNAIDITTIIKQKEVEKYETNYKINYQTHEKLTVKQQLILELNKQEITRKEALEILSPSIIKSLISKNVLIPELITSNRAVTHIFDLEDKKIILNSDQQKEYEKVNLNKYETYLLYGVTGSGKTEIYLKLIEDTLNNHKKALILVPEIMLIGPFAQRLKSKFDESIVSILHSNLNSGQKYDEYQKIKNNKAKIILGTRSAIFSPISDLGIIIIDEEQDDSYIQDDTVSYDTRQIAQTRAKYHQIPLLLGSASPSVETFYKATNKEYKLLKLTKRALVNHLPNVKLIDMREELKKGNLTPFSTELKSQIEEKLSKNEQIILFMNRKGYSPFVMCRHCGNVPKCPDCQISLTYYKNKNILKCQHCGYEEPFSKECTVCKKNTVKEVGVGIEYIEQELHKHFNAKVLRLDADTTSKKNSHEHIWDDFKNHKADILLGTQMVAKGLDFSNVTLVGIIMADGLLKVPSIKAVEKTFQLILQASGRSGRSKKGDVVIQSYDINHYAIKTASTLNNEEFFKQVLFERKIQKMPPFKKVSQLLIEHPSYLKTYQIADRIKILLSKTMIVLGPTPSLIQKRDNKYRVLLTLKYDTIDKKIEEEINNFKDVETKIYFSQFATLI